MKEKNQYTVKYKRFSFIFLPILICSIRVLPAACNDDSTTKNSQLEDIKCDQVRDDFELIKIFVIEKWLIYYQRDPEDDSRYLLLTDDSEGLTESSQYEEYDDEQGDGDDNGDDHAETVQACPTVNNQLVTRVVKLPSAELQYKKTSSVTAKVMLYAFQYLREKHLLQDEKSSHWKEWERSLKERDILITFYYSVLANETDRLSLTDGGNWLSDEPVCNWVGVSCGALPPKALPPQTQPKSSEPRILEPLPADAVTAIQLPSLGLTGTIPSQLGQLKYLYKLRLDHNQLKGVLPSELAQATTIRYIDFSYNRLQGSIPSVFGQYLTALQYFSLQKNYITGSLPWDITAWNDSLQHLDLAENRFSGTINHQLQNLSNLQFLALDDNLFTGQLPPKMGQTTTKLRHFDVASNVLSGSIPSHLGGCHRLEQVVVGENILSGTFPSELLRVSKLQVLVLSNNHFHGTLPNSKDWAAMTDLGVFYVQDNNLTGTIPKEMFHVSQKEMRLIDVSRNHLGGTIPTEVGLMTGLHLIHAAGNRFTGTLPKEMENLHKNLRLNFTDNLITGEIPSLFCGQGSSTLSLLYHDFGCAAVLCPAGTFNQFGHATLHSGCRECPDIPPGEHNVLGRISCGNLLNLYGDLDSDGFVSQREVLRLLFITTIGRFWGQRYQSWALMDVNECDLEGVVCVRGTVTKIDLSGAEICSNGERQPGGKEFCLGLPTEIGLLTGLETLQLSRQRFLMGTIPTEIGHLTKLRYFDVSSNILMKGTIPTEVGRLSNLVHFMASFCRFRGSLPSELFRLTRLEKLHLTDNELTGTFPEKIELHSLKELMVSRNIISGTLPSAVGNMKRLENFEVYGNQLSGSIPSEIALCPLKRIDIFNNHITGTIPIELASLRSLQIVHCKHNDISGTIPSEFGSLPDLSWFDFSGNYLHGSIPSSFGSSTSIRDFRVADNMLHEPVPESFCSNQELNSGMTAYYGCDGVVCPLGTYAENGFASSSNDGCIPCPDGESTVYIGSTTCRAFDDKDILSIIHAVMEGIAWPPLYDKTWNKENTIAVCDWHGVTCDADGDISSLTIPVQLYDGY